MNSLFSTVITNALIVLCVLAVAVTLKDPLALFGLLLLKDIPNIVQCQCDVPPDGEDAVGNPMGFV